MRYLSRKLFGIIITSLITLSPLSIAFADESTLPIGESEQKVGSKSNPSIATPAPKENSLGSGKPISPFGGADNYPIGAPMSEAVGGGPASGLASSNGILGSGLPNEVESAWPSPGSILHFPNREVRVSFKNKVDTRTFSGQVYDSKTGKPAMAKDGAPALFTRSVESEPRSLDVIGTVQALQAGEYIFKWSVKSEKGKQIEGSISFEQLSSVVARGASNHRHGDLKIPGLNILLVLSRLLIIFSIVFSAGYAYSRLWARYAAGAILVLSGSIYTAAFSIPAYYSDLNRSEIIGRLDGWAAFAVLFAGVVAVFCRTRTEIFFATLFASAAAISTTYTPMLEYGSLHVGLLAGSLLGGGLFIASSLKLYKMRKRVQALLLFAACSTPALSILIAAGTLNPSRGQFEDLKEKLLAGSIALLFGSISIFLDRFGGSMKTVSYLKLPIAAGISIAIAIATSAPSLL